MQVKIFENLDVLSEALVQWIISDIRDRLKIKKRFSIVLSGGNTPKLLYQLLASSPYKEQVDWARIDFFWGDERAVPFEDDRNNAKMAFETLLNHLAVAPSQIHVMRTDISPEKSADDYEQILKNYFPKTILKDNVPSFDVVLLGMGDDGHTLSLFPGTSMMHEEKYWVRSLWLPQQNMFRITLTKAIVNLSAKIVFLASGAGKAEALHEVLYGAYDPDRFPSQVIRPNRGELFWFADQVAAAKLKR